MPPDQNPEPYDDTLATFASEEASAAESVLLSGFVLTRIQALRKPGLEEGLTTEADTSPCACHAVCPCVPDQLCACNAACSCDTVEACAAFCSCVGDCGCDGHVCGGYCEYSCEYFVSYAPC